jgi:hypothetical protein
MASELHPQLASIRDQLEAAAERARRLVGSTPHDKLLFRPDRKTWSALQCLVHLNLTSQRCLPLLAEAVERAPAAPVGGRFRVGFTGRLLLWVLEPPYRMRVKTTPAFEPFEAADPNAVSAEFTQLQKRVVELVERANGHALDRVHVVSPFQGRVRYTLLASFLIIPAHQRRHLWQAEQVLKRAPS